MRRTLDLFDLARIDHFRGLVAYWAVPARARTARHGAWKRGPGIALFRALERELDALPLVAEDLGVITEPVERLRTQVGLPGMLVIQFGMDTDEPRSVHRLANHTADRVVYTSTHDQETARGWLESLDARTRAFVDSEVARLGFTDRRRHLGVHERARSRIPGFPTLGRCPGHGWRCRRRGRRCGCASRWTLLGWWG